jgi:hypothetical protein
MAGVDPQWDTGWFDRFKRIYATNITAMSIYPGSPLAWLRIADEPYGMKQVQRPLRNPSQRVHITKNEEYPEVKYAESRVIERDMPNLSDAINIKEEYYAGDTANALGAVGDLALNFQDGIVNFVLNGSTTDPASAGILLDVTSASTTVNNPGHVDTASACSTTGTIDVIDDFLASLATLEYELEAKGFYGRKIMLAPPAVKPFVQRYIVDYTSTPYTEILGMPWFYSPHVDSGATTAAAAIYMVDADSFELHMTPVKARAYWSDAQECYCWRWKTRLVPIGIPKWDGTDWTKGIVGFDVDSIA